MSMTLRVTFDGLEKNKLIKSHESKEVFRENVFNLQSCMNEMVELKTEPEINHYHAPGMYAREMIVKKGVTLVGKIHRHSHINVISKGCIEVVTEFGSAVYEAPFTFVSEAGVKRCMNVLSDAIWTTFHTANTDDIAQLEKDLVVDSYEELEGGDL